MKWRPMKTAPKDGTAIVIIPRCYPNMSDVTPCGPMVARWGSHEDYPEWEAGWVVYEGRYSTLFAPAADGWIPLPTERPASAMSAGTAETQSGSGLQPASAVPQGDAQ